MSKKYLLDANIVIKIWNEYPQLLNVIEDTDDIDYKIPQNIAGELSIKEFKDINGIPVLTDRFLKLLGHIIDNDGSALSKDYEKNMYISNANKISVNDYSLIQICENNKEYILVTEDKRILQNAMNILEPYRVLNFNEFIENIKKYVSIF